MNHRRADIIAYKPNGDLVLVAEVKGKSDADRRWAREFRGNLLRYDMIADAKYFLLAMPSRFFLWTDAQGRPEAEPDFDLDPASLLKPYLRKDEDPPSAPLSPFGLELILGSFLQNIAAGDPLADADESTRRAILGSGLAKDLKGAKITYEDAA